MEDNSTPHKDVTGYPIRIGDEVVYSHGGRYHGFSAYTVAGYTPKMLRLRHMSQLAGQVSSVVSPRACAVVSGRPER